MGFLVAAAVGLFAYVALGRARRPSRGRRAAGVVLGAIAVLGVLAAVASFGAAAFGDTGDMDPPQVALLGLMYLAVGAGAALAARQLWRR